MEPYVLDDYKREGLDIEVDLSLPGERVTRSLDQIIEWRGKPTQNVYIERFNRTVRHEWLDLYLFEDVQLSVILLFDGVPVTLLDGRLSMGTSA